MYCPKCKNYDELDFDPLENIESFMKYVQQEQRKWKAFNMIYQHSKNKRRSRFTNELA